MPPKPQNLLGQRFGMLTVRECAGRKNGVVVWLCQCDCGHTSIVRTYGLTSGSIARCRYHSAYQRHGLSNTPEWETWSSMRKRCLDPGHHAYRHYGGRGIKIHASWERFEQFLNDMGQRPNGTSLDRINNDGDYEPGNCRWATTYEQIMNARGTVSFLTLDGEILSIPKIADYLALSHWVLRRKFERAGVMPATVHR